jgi:excisionase family DNA binding protein
MTVIVTTEEALRSLIREEVARAVPANADEWMAADDVAKMLGVKRGTIPALVSREALPCYRPGKGYTFRRSEVEAWLVARTNKPGARPSRGTLSALPGGKR